jgi:lipopolysaccharide/colanic/teichoic acid biosynthesis glycosyltransferase
MLFPGLLLLAVLIKVTSKGAIFYISEKVGHKSKVFRQFKFRSMYDKVQPVLTNDLRYIVTRNDSRITPIGRFLRIGFDELPQLWNVVRGEMTLIGPRPHSAWFMNYYNDIVSKRLMMLPGITSLAVVCNGRALSDAESNMLDVYYVENYSLAMDFRIFCFTIIYMLEKKGIGLRILQSIKDDPRYDLSKYDITSSR